MSGRGGRPAEAVRRAAYRGLRLLPARVRNLLVRWSSPTFSVAAVVLIRDDAGRVLMVRPVYRDWWGLPGGMVDRGEAPADCAVRETREEVAAAVELLGDPVVVVDVHWHRVEFVFRGRLVGPVDAVRPGGAEIAEVGWWDPDGVGPVGLHGRWMVDAVEAAWAEGRSVVLSPRLPAAERGLRPR